MAIEATRERVVARIWQAVARSGVSLGSLERTQQQKLVDAIADEMLGALDDLAGEEAGRLSPASEALPGDEQVLWEGRPYLSVFTHYQVTTQRVRVRKGLLSRETDDIELIRIQDIDVSQKMGERMVNIGDIKLHSADKSTPLVVLENVHDPNTVHEILRKATQEARRKNRVLLRDDV